MRTSASNSDISPKGQSLVLKQPCKFLPGSSLGRGGGGGGGEGGWCAIGLLRALPVIEVAF